MKTIIAGKYPYFNERNFGGVESVLYNLKNGFDKYQKDFPIEVLTGSNKTKGYYEKNQDIHYIKKPNFKFGSVFLSYYPIIIKKFLKEKNFEIINSHSIDFAYYSLKYKKKLIFTLHGITWNEKKYTKLISEFAWDYYYVKRLLKILKKINFFISINPYSKNMVLDKKINAEIFSIPNPVADEFFKIRDNTRFNRLLYIGGISKRKNLLNLIKSLNIVKKEIKDFKLIVAGKIIDNNYFETILNYISKNNLKKNFNYIGKITEEQKYEEFSKMNLLVLTSLQETAPMVISESFACGKPVIASNICGIPYMLNNERNGLLIDPNDTKNIANKIIYLLENQNMIKEKKRNARKYAKENFSQKKITKKYKKAYNRILEIN